MSHPAPSRAVDVLVVGGGPAGLAAALAAARRGDSVLLVERADRLGGMAASIGVGGQRVDLGSHRLHPSAAPRVRALLDELLGADLQVRTRNGRLHLADRWVRFPLQAADVMRSVPPGVGMRIAGDLLTGRWRRARDESYGEFVRAGLGPTTLSRFHGPMAEKLWGRPTDDLSGFLAERRIAVRDGSGLLRRIARTSRPEGRTFLYPRLGYGQIVERMAEEATAAGAEIRTGLAVRALQPGEPVGVTLTDGTAVRAGRMLWTAPIGALTALAPGAPDIDFDHRGVALCYLVVDEDRYSPVDAHYVPDPDVAFARLSEPKNYRDGPDPAGRTVLCAEVPASPGDEHWEASDDELAGAVLDGMDRCGLRRPPLAGIAVHRLPRVYPVLPAGGDLDRARLLTWAARIEGVTVLGRQGLLVADNLHHVIDMALSAVDCLRPDGWDEGRWWVERLRFEQFVVDD